MAACISNRCGQRSEFCRSRVKCGLVTDNGDGTGHGRHVDTEVHEAPATAPGCHLPRSHQPEVFRPMAFFRLFRFYRQSGSTFRRAIARAWTQSR